MDSRNTQEDAAVLYQHINIIITIHSGFHGTKLRKYSKITTKCPCRNQGNTEERVQWPCQAYLLDYTIWSLIIPKPRVCHNLHLWVDSGSWCHYSYSNQWFHTKKPMYSQDLVLPLTNRKGVTQNSKCLCSSIITYECGIRKTWLSQKKPKQKKQPKKPNQLIYALPCLIMKFFNFRAV